MDPPRLTRAASKITAYVLSFLSPPKTLPSLNVVFRRADSIKLEVPDEELMQQLGVMGHTFDYLVCAASSAFNRLAGQSIIIFGLQGLSDLPSDPAIDYKPLILQVDSLEPFAGIYGFELNKSFLGNKQSVCILAVPGHHDLFSLAPAGLASGLQQGRRQALHQCRHVRFREVQVFRSYSRGLQPARLPGLCKGGAVPRLHLPVCQLSS